MARKGKGAASAATPSKGRRTMNSNRGREAYFPNERYESLANAERARTLGNWGITHERIIHFPEGDEDFMVDRIQGLGWGFMYSAFIPINLTVVREFYYNFSAPSEDDIFKKTVTTYNAGNLDMGGVFEVIGREGTTWANDPAITVIPKKLDNSILNDKATAWHKVIIANIDPKTHATNFLMDHALLIFVLMTDGIVNLPRIMRDVMLKRPSGNSNNLLLYLMFIVRLANHYQVPEFARDEIVNIREVDMYCPYGDWKGEQPKVRRGRIIPAQAKSVPPPEQHPPSPQPQPSATIIPSASVKSSPELSMKDIMRYQRRKERLQRNTQAMIHEVFPVNIFTGLVQVSSTKDDSDGDSTQVLKDNVES
ncbi:hypothetical protein PIB30_096403 [Stylosanthes scabra]|uniref:Putative plant transposon protein domain-containing protein n=1 Tax=Stylosanthes scabra TaxID=79078 RepID=A0ABU6QWM2_9FABA|nr:hypothetical protein [Stylosanthes scabra]